MLTSESKNLRHNPVITSVKTRQNPRQKEIKVSKVLTS
jgi:hypothetical protein